MTRSFRVLERQRDLHRNPSLPNSAPDSCRTIGGFESATGRAIAYQEVGADLPFGEVPTSTGQIQPIRLVLVGGPQLTNLLAGTVS